MINAVNKIERIGDFCHSGARGFRDLGFDEKLESTAASPRCSSELPLLICRTDPV